MHRRHILKTLATLGIGNVVLHRTLAAQIDEGSPVTAHDLQQAEWISGIHLTPEERETLTGKIDQLQERLQTLRDYPLPDDLQPAMRFAVLDPPSGEPPTAAAAFPASPPIARPPSDAALAFLSVQELATLLRSGQVTSEELTEIYLDRLQRHHPKLHCLVTLTPELARQQAKKADQELAVGHDRGPLHGIPWGAKDLIAYPEHPTTWGVPQFRERILPHKATVARRLDEAGAVLLGKLSLGALAMGDRWFEGLTRNPWNLDQGSSGSSAGSAAATAAGLVAFSLGSETLGSIVSPSRRCGTTGLRPTFGRVSRHGCMALSWSMDKIGPLTRSVHDAAVILGALQGPDPSDPTTVDAPFAWPPPAPNQSVRVGYGENLSPDEENALDHLKSLGFTTLPVELPRGFPAWELSIILTAEAATSFHTWTRERVTEGLNTWPQEFRQGHFITAVDYLRANQIRTALMREMQTLFQGIDVLLGGGEDELVISNLTGHPSVVIPNGREKDDQGNVRIRSLKFTGACFGESQLLQVAAAYQDSTLHHRDHPPGFDL